jgi:hypothetical protein
MSPSLGQAQRMARPGRSRGQAGTANRFRATSDETPISLANFREGGERVRDCWSAAPAPGPTGTPWPPRSRRPSPPSPHARRSCSSTAIAEVLTDWQVSWPTGTAGCSRSTPRAGSRTDAPPDRVATAGCSATASPTSPRLRGQAAGGQPGHRSHGRHRPRGRHPCARHREELMPHALTSHRASTGGPAQPNVRAPQGGDDARHHHHHLRQPHRRA